MLPRRGMDSFLLYMFLIFITSSIGSFLATVAPYLRQLLNGIVLRL